MAPRGCCRFCSRRRSKASAADASSGSFSDAFLKYFRRRFAASRPSTFSLGGRVRNSPRSSVGARSIASASGHWWNWRTAFCRRASWEEAAALLVASNCPAPVASQGSKATQTLLRSPFSASNCCTAAARWAAWRDWCGARPGGASKSASAARVPGGGQALWGPSTFPLACWLCSRSPDARNQRAEPWLAQIHPPRRRPSPPERGYSSLPHPEKAGGVAREPFASRAGASIVAVSFGVPVLRFAGAERMRCAAYSGLASPNSITALVNAVHGRRN